MGISEEKLFRAFHYIDPEKQKLADRVTREYAPMIMQDLEREIEYLKMIMDERG